MEDIDVQLRLSLLKPLHASWLVDLYNEFTSSKGKDIIISGWRASGILDALKLGSVGLPSIDPFDDIDPLVSQEHIHGEIQTIHQVPKEERVLGFTRQDDNSDSDSDWEMGDGPVAFDMFKDFCDDIRLL